MSEHYDVIVIGTGAGGGTLARHLAPSGKRILLLERGDWLPREPANWSTADVFIDGRYVSPDSWYSTKGKSFFQPQVHYFVGGATKLYGAALYRMREEDFGDLRHHDGLSPAWPISYQDMEPCYTAAEQLYQVHGARGEDPTEPPADGPCPYPAVSHEPRIQQLSDDLAKGGYHPFRAPCGILVNETNLPYSICVRCADCDGFPCPLHAKADAEVIGVRPAPEHENVTLLRNARAVKLETNPAGTAVTQIVVERDGDTERYEGDIVVVACGAANSAKLLLASANDKHPNGLANGSDQVGRNFMYHDSQAAARCRDARRRLLAVHRGSAATGQPGHARPGRQRPHRLHAEQPHRGQAAFPPAQVDARLSRHDIPVAGCAHQAGTVRFPRARQPLRGRYQHLPHALGPPSPPVRVHENRSASATVSSTGSAEPETRLSGRQGPQPVIQFLCHPVPQLGAQRLGVQARHECIEKPGGAAQLITS